MSSPLLDMYLGKFQAVGEPALVAICNCKVPSMVFLDEYKKLPPIETMLEKEKQEMKLFINETFPDKSIEEKTDIEKIVYTVGNLL